MSQVTVNNHRIAKNTLLLYFRMILLMLVSLYTSRVVLDRLGTENYGIYNVVGSFVAMFSMVSGAMVGATQRFLSFELGKKEGDVSNVFRTVVTIHIFLALVIFILGESLGVWIVNEYLNFSEDRYGAANWVFQFSLIAFMFNIVNIPYNAAIVAYERMQAFAYISILEAVLKLIVAYLLYMSPLDVLVFYASLQTVVAIILRLTYNKYCTSHFPECHYQWHFDKSIGKSIFSYSGWNFLGAWAGVFRGQGVSMVLNNYFGAVANAAQGISNQVLSAITGLVQNFQMAMNPQIIKRYAAGEVESMFNLVFSGSRFAFILLLVVSTPIIVEAPFVLGIWLKNVPPFAVEFLRITIYVALMDALSRNLVTAMQASGIVRNSNIAMVIISSMAMPVAYILFIYGYPAYYAAVAQCIISFFCLIARVVILRRIINFPARQYFIDVVLRMTITALLIIVPCNLISMYFESTLSTFVHIINMLVTICIGLCVCAILGVKKSERITVYNNIKNFVSKRLHNK